MNAKQTDRIVLYMRTFGSITPLQALSDLGCMRLASRIKDLKRMGYKIRTEYVNGTNRFGDKTRFAQYSLIEEGQQYGI